MLLDVVAEGFEACLQQRHGAHQGLGQWPQGWESLAHTSNQVVDAPKINLAFAFGAVA
jgi:hypothetical protein